jgi:hypothetical protein
VVEQAEGSSELAESVLPGWKKKYPAAPAKLFALPLE